jgi:hypothetical protein
LGELEAQTVVFGISSRVEATFVGNAQFSKKTIGGTLRCAGCQYGAKLALFRSNVVVLTTSAVII